MMVITVANRTAAPVEIILARGNGSFRPVYKEAGRVELGAVFRAVNRGAEKKDGLLLSGVSIWTLYGGGKK